MSDFFTATENVSDGQDLARQILCEQLDFGLETEQIMASPVNAGTNFLQELSPEGLAMLRNAFDNIAPGFVDAFLGFSFGEIFTRPGLPLTTRFLVTIAGLTASGTAAPQLAGYIRTAIAAGCSQQEIVETIVQQAPYAGLPAAMNGLTTAKTVFDSPAEPRLNAWHRAMNY